MFGTHWPILECVEFSDDFSSQKHTYNREIKFTLPVLKMGFYDSMIEPNKHYVVPFAGLAAIGLLLNLAPWYISYTAIAGGIVVVYLRSRPEAVKSVVKAAKLSAAQVEASLLAEEEAELVERAARRAAMKGTAKKAAIPTPTPTPAASVATTAPTSSASTQPSSKSKKAKKDAAAATLSGALEDPASDDDEAYLAAFVKGGNAFVRAARPIGSKAADVATAAASKAPASSEGDAADNDAPPSSNGSSRRRKVAAASDGSGWTTKA